MINRILGFGILAGVLVAVPLFTIVLGLKDAPGGAWGMAIGYLIMLVALSTIFVAVKRERDERRGGVIRFWPAFGMGLGISAVAGICYVAAWDATLALLHQDFAATYAQAEIARQQAAGVSGAALAQVRAQMAEFQQQYANPLFRWPMTFAEIFPVGVLVSLISAALLRNSRFMPAARG